MTTTNLSSLLVSQIKTHHSIKNEALLQNTNWTRSCFELVSSKINDYLSTQLSFDQIRKKGSTVSYKTLNKIFKNEYNFSYPLDPRALNTLDKLAIFIGHESWSSFVAQKFESDPIRLEEYRIIDEQSILDMMKHNLHDVFNSMTNLSNENTINLEKYYTQDSNALKLVKETINHYRNQKCTITNELNSSTFELMECKLDNISHDKAIVSTREFWRLFWYSNNEKRYINRYCSISDHKYLLCKTSGIWKIKTNITSQDFLN